LTITFKIPPKSHIEITDYSDDFIYYRLDKKRSLTYVEEGGRIYFVKYMPADGAKKCFISVFISYNLSE